MKYCKLCVLPDSRPNLYILSDGICTACYSKKNLKKINWNIRKTSFLKLVSNLKKKNNLYDCVVPVSGGKDSTWQIIEILKNNLKPLAFTYKPVLRTKIGQQNLDNLKKLGVDHIEFSISEKTEQKFLKKAFYKFGAVAIPMHMAMWNISFNLAKKFSVPYIVWGENSAIEYGGAKKDQNLKNLDNKWIKKFGINFGTTAKDWVDKDLTRKDMAPFFKDETKTKKNPKSIFLGDYFNWDPNKSFHVAKKNGFKSYKKISKTGIYNYADIGYVGGGMGKTGLHNTLEPAVFKIPVIIGKNFDKFPEVSELVNLKGFISIKNARSFKSQMNFLLENNKIRIEMGQINYNYINKNLGATKKVMSYLKQKK